MKGKGKVLVTAPALPNDSQTGEERTSEDTITDLAHHHTMFPFPGQQHVPFMGEIAQPEDSSSIGAMGMSHMQMPPLQFQNGQNKMKERLRGAVRWFDDQKGYGFITPVDGTEDVFVHQTAIKADGYRTLHQDEEVAFDVEYTLEEWKMKNKEDPNRRRKALQVTAADGGAVKGGPDPRKIRKQAKADKVAAKGKELEVAELKKAQTEPDTIGSLAESSGQSDSTNAGLVYNNMFYGMRAIPVSPPNGYAVYPPVYAQSQPLHQQYSSMSLRPRSPQSLRQQRLFNSHNNDRSNGPITGPSAGSNRTSLRATAQSYQPEPPPPRRLPSVHCASSTIACHVNVPGP